MIFIKDVDVDDMEYRELHVKVGREHMGNTGQIYQREAWTRTLNAVADMLRLGHQFVSSRRCQYSINFHELS